MKKLLLILTILLMSANWSWATEYSPDVTAADSGEVGGAGDFISRINYKLAMTSTQDVLVLYEHNSTSLSIRTLYSSNWGTTWGTYPVAGTFVTTAAQYTGFSIYAFGDSAYALDALGTSTDDLHVRMYSGVDTLCLDTVYPFCPSGSHVPGLVAFPDGKLLIHHAGEGGTLDSIRSLQSDGPLTKDAIWTNREAQDVTRYQGGVRAPFTWSGGVKGGIAILDAANEDLYWADTTGLDTLSTAIVPNNIPAIGSTNGQGMIWMVPVKDSFGIVVWQTSTTAASCSTVVRPFHINTTGGTGSYTITYDANAVALTTPGAAKNGWVTQPTASTLWGTDTVLAYCWYWPDTTKPLQAQLCRWISGDKGVTWGTRTVDRDSTGYTRATTPWELQAAPRIYRNGNDIRQALMYCDSIVATPGDNLRMWLSTITTTPPAQGKRTLIRRVMP